jgi:hypothetical protein
MLTYADVCWHMLTYADVCAGTELILCLSIIQCVFADVCWRMLTYADVCAGKELILCLSIIQCVFAITRQWWYVVERGIPSLLALLVQKYKY